MECTGKIQISVRKWMSRKRFQSVKYLSSKKLEHKMIITQLKIQTLRSINEKRNLMIQREVMNYEQMSQQEKRKRSLLLPVHSKLVETGNLTCRK